MDLSGHDGGSNLPSTSQAATGNKERDGESDVPSARQTADDEGPAPLPVVDSVSSGRESRSRDVERAGRPTQHTVHPIEHGGHPTQRAAHPTISPDSEGQLDVGDCPASNDDDTSTLTRKSLVERKRRERMNRLIEHLKELLIDLGVIRPDEAGCLSQTETLRKVIAFLSRDEEDFKAGVQRCLREVSRYRDVLGDRVTRHLLIHLQSLSPDQLYARHVRYVQQQQQQRHLQGAVGGGGGLDTSSSGLPWYLDPMRPRSSWSPSRPGLSAVDASSSASSFLPPPPSGFPGESAFLRRYVPSLSTSNSSLLAPVVASSAAFSSSLNSATSSFLSDVYPPPSVGVGSVVASASNPDPSAVSGMFPIHRTAATSVFPGATDTSSYPRATSTHHSDAPFYHGATSTYSTTTSTPGFLSQTSASVPLTLNANPNP